MAVRRAIGENVWLEVMQTKIMTAGQIFHSTATDLTVSQSRSILSHGISHIKIARKLKHKANKAIKE